MRTKFAWAVVSPNGVIDVESLSFRKSEARAYMTMFEEEAGYEVRRVQLTLLPRELSAADRRKLIAAAAKGDVMIVIQAIGFASGAPCPHANQFVMTFDHEAHGGQGEGTFTPDVVKAMKFATMEAAFGFWRKQSVTKPRRDYGDFGPNRPFTAVTVMIAPEGEFLCR